MPEPSAHFPHGFREDPHGAPAELREGLVATARERLRTEVRDAVDTGQHYWTLTALHRLSQADLVAVRVAGMSTHLDSSSLREVRAGCFICEVPLDPALLGGRCPGDPEGRD